MTTTHVAVLLGLLLFVGGALSALLLVVGPNRVEHETVELFRGEQQVIAEQGAIRVATRLAELQTRVDEAAEHLVYLEMTQDRRLQLQTLLPMIRRPDDSDLQLVLVLVGEDGTVQASAPDVSDERAMELVALDFARESADDSPPLLCKGCHYRDGSVSVVSSVDGGRRLVVNFRLDSLFEDIFEPLAAGRHSRAALLDADGRVLFSDVDRRIASTEAVITGTASLPDATGRVLVEAPRSAVTPEVRRAVSSVVYPSLGMLAVFMAALGLFVFLIQREQARHVEQLETLAQTDKLATVGMMGASVAHEIRNVIAAIDLNLELARRAGSDDGQRFLEKASRSTGRLEELADSITGYVRGNGDGNRIFCLREAVEDGLELVRPKMHPELVRYEPEANPEVLGSSAAVTHVVVNLLLNAYDATNRLKEPRIEVRVAEADGEAILEVADNGPGIDPAIFEQIFDPFTSTKGEDVEAEGGTGIGLWLCAEIAEQHGGDIRAENRDTGGAVVTLRLPLADRADPLGESCDEGSQDAQSVDWSG